MPGENKDWLVDRPTLVGDELHLPGGRYPADHLRTLKEQMPEVKTMRGMGTAPTLVVGDISAIHDLTFENVTFIAKAK